MSGKRAFLELLKQEGVTVMFGNPGTTELPLMDAFAVEHDIRYILGLQEAALMCMADGYAQASGDLAVLNLHVAPGLGNAMGMLYDAMKANAPVLVTAGQQDLEYLVTEPVLTADLPTLTTTPSIGPSLVELTSPESADMFCAETCERSIARHAAVASNVFVNRTRTSRPHQFFAVGESLVRS